jgi:hypothetical protein
LLDVVSEVLAGGADCLMEKTDKTLFESLRDIMQVAGSKSRTEIKMKKDAIKAIKMKRFKIHRILIRLTGKCLRCPKITEMKRILPVYKAKIKPVAEMEVWRIFEALYQKRKWMKILPKFLSSFSTRW